MEVNRCHYQAAQKERCEEKLGFQEQISGFCELR